MAAKTTNLSLASNISAFSVAEGENLDFFLENINQVAILEKWPPERKFLVLKLNITGDALRFISSHPRINSMKTFEDLTNLLKTKFAKEKNFAQLQNSFKNINQRQGQSVNELVDEIEDKANSYLGLNDTSSNEMSQMAEKIKSQKLLDALRPEIRVEVMKMGCTKFSDIAQNAKNVERALNVVDLTSNNLSQSTTFDLLLRSQDQTNSALNELTKKFEESQNKIVNNVQAQLSNQRNTENRISCHICQKNHLTTQCWDFPRYQSQSQNNYRSSFRRFRGGRRNNFNNPNFRANNTSNSNNRHRPYYNNRFRGRQNSYHSRNHPSNQNSLN